MYFSKEYLIHFSIKFIKLSNVSNVYSISIICIPVTTSQSFPLTTDCTVYFFSSFYLNVSSSFLFPSEIHSNTEQKKSNKMRLLGNLFSVFFVIQISELIEFFHTLQLHLSYFSKNDIKRKPS